MKLEYLDDLADGGRYIDVVSERLIRLYDFDRFQAQMLKEEIEGAILERRTVLNLGTLNFIEPLNCNLILHLADMDSGIAIIGDGVFGCYLTMKAYRQMVYLIEPFCTQEIYGYQWFGEDAASPVDFLFSPDGSW